MPSGEYIPKGRPDAAYHTNPGDGKIEGDSEAMDMWSRSYQPRWKPTV